ncbi:hypothetical protein [Sphingopyxis witflariensis]|nr:hypothetical protein [Sphingopyxis witflariensis]
MRYVSTLLVMLLLAIAGASPSSAQTMYSENVEVALVPMHQWAAPGPPPG